MSKQLSISVDTNTDKLQLKLRAIAKHVEALADELDAIDNTWQCECGSLSYHDIKPTWTDRLDVIERYCNRCNRCYVRGKEATDNDDLPTRLEGSD